MTALHFPLSRPFAWVELGYPELLLRYTHGRTNERGLPSSDTSTFDFGCHLRTRYLTTQYNMLGAQSG
jgi:hypothetical protein